MTLLKKFEEMVEEEKKAVDEYLDMADEIDKMGGPKKFVDAFISIANDEMNHATKIHKIWWKLLTGRDL